MIYERRRQSTQERIIHATIETLLERGYSKCRITEIAERADIGRGTFYRYFEDVDAVLLAFFAQEFAIVESRSAELMNLESPQRELLMWQGAFAYFSRFYELFSKIEGEESQLLWEKFEQYTIGRFMRHLQDWNLAYTAWMNLPIEVMGTFAAAGVLALTRRWLAGELPYDSKTMAEMVYKLLYHQ